MLGLMVLTIAVALSIAGYALKNITLLITSTTGWILLSIYAYTMSAGAWDVYYGLFFFGIFAAIMNGLNAGLSRPSEEKAEEDSELLKEAKELYPGDDDAQRIYMESKTSSLEYRKKNKAIRDSKRPPY